MASENKMGLEKRKAQFHRLLKKNILCVDVEATCSDNMDVPRDEMEVIEFGGVLLDRDTLEVKERIEFFVKPTIHPILTDFCKGLTNITQEQVDGGRTHAWALSLMSGFTKQFGKEFSWCSWGAFDKNIFLQDAEFHGTAPLLDPQNHFNLKVWFSNLHDKKNGFGLNKAVKYKGLTFIGQHHRALSDAENVAQILRTMISEG